MEGDLQPLYLLLTDCYIYLLRKGKCPRIQHALALLGNRGLNNACSKLEHAVTGVGNRKIFIQTNKQEFISEFDSLTMTV